MKGEILAECLKMRRTFLYPFHVALPILANLLFLFYFRFNGWSEREQISGYMEVLGITLPFVISIVCTGNIALEEQNHFQILLGSHTHKWRGLWLKWIVLVGLELAAISFAVVLFGVGYHFGLGKEGLSAKMYLQVIGTLFGGSIFLYLEHLFLNLMFTRNVSLCIGVIEVLLSALFLTGLGEGRWHFFPCTWSARGVLLLLNGGEMTKIAFCYLLLPVIICVIIGVWIHFYEGRQCND